MRKINNPFAGHFSEGEYNCFGCSPANINGLHLNFWKDDDILIAKWQPQKTYEGWSGVLHGGIQSTLMDEAAAWFVFVFLKTAGVTSRLNVVYKKPVYIVKGVIIIRARLRLMEGRAAHIDCTLEDGEGQICAHAEVTYFCFPEKIAREKYRYPGAEAFLSAE